MRVPTGTTNAPVPNHLGTSIEVDRTVQQELQLQTDPIQRTFHSEPKALIAIGLIQCLKSENLRQLAQRN